MSLSPSHPPRPSPARDRMRELLFDLTRFQRVLTLPELTHFVGSAGLTREDLACMVEFREDGYTHHAVFRSRHLEVGCIGWRPGQHTPIHDHHDSVCCMLVVDGLLTNTTYRPHGSATVAAVDTRRLRAGELLGLDHGAIHRLSNEHAASVVTMHVYSPPLPPMHDRIRQESVRLPTEGCNSVEP
jgi:cysteine dioxygenase